MKTTCYFICAVVMQLYTSFCNAQTIELKPAPANVVIDGNAAEWGDLPYSNSKAKISYAIANDKNNLYLVVKTNDYTEQRDIIGSGLTFGVDTKGKKKATNAITFPAQGDEEGTALIIINDEQLRSKIEQTQYRKIHPEGFKNITDAELTPLNAYGIQVAIGYDANGFLVYEEAIPLALFNADDAANNEWAFNIKINGLLKKKDPPQLSGTRADVINYQYTKYQPNEVPLSPSIDFFGKFTLAK